jgi:hypothetical protein
VLHEVVEACAEAYVGSEALRRAAPARAESPTARVHSPRDP